MDKNNNLENEVTRSVSELESIKSDLDNHSLDIQNKPSAVQAYASEVYSDVKRNVLDPVGRGLRTAVAYPILGQFPKEFRKDFAKKHDWYNEKNSFVSSLLFNGVFELVGAGYCSYAANISHDTPKLFFLTMVGSVLGCFVGSFHLIGRSIDGEFDTSGRASLYYTVASLPFKGAKKLYSAVSDYVSDVSDRVHDKRHQIDSHNNKEVMQYNARVKTKYDSLNEIGDSDV